MIKEKKENYHVADDVIGEKVLFVNYYMIGQPGEGNSWVLVDAALPGSAKRIIKEASELYGENNPPKAIILTHGHFDHVGALPELLKVWPEVKVFAHNLEAPYLSGKSAYPPPEPLAGGGGMAYMSWLYPHKPINISDRLEILPESQELPFLPDWKYIHTPGHSPGHISLFREKDKVLIAGDAFVSTNQNALWPVITQKKELHGPPAYFTIHWQNSLESIKKLTQLEPEFAGTGHGLPMEGKALIEDLQKLVADFGKKELPVFSRYKSNPVETDENGVVDMPSPLSYKIANYTAAFFGIAALATVGFNIVKYKLVKRPTR